MADRDPAPEHRAVTVTESVVRQLRADIQSGELAPGTRLRQMEIAQRMGISSTPVREAFAMLEREGLVVSSTHRGVIVFKPTVSDLQEIYQIRTHLEVHAIEMAATRITDEEVEMADQILQEMGALGESAADEARFVELNREFHSRLYACARMPKLERIITEVRSTSEAYVFMHRSLTRSSSETQQEHVEILEALRQRDPDRAAAAMRTHLGHTLADLEARMSELEDATE